MATTFDVIFLGVQADIDTYDGDQVAENAAALEGLTIGSAADPLFGNIQTLSPGSTGYSGGFDSSAYELDAANETFRIDGGSDQTFDMGMAYNATLTYTDGTTASFTAAVIQDVDGNTYLVPHQDYNADQVAMEAKPIEAITLHSAVYSDGIDDGWDLAADRYATDFATPDSVDGTSGDDGMGVGHVDAGGDIIDGADGDNDTIYGYGGNDEIHGGDGDDVIGDWSLEDGNDTLYGDAGADTLIGGAGDDILHGGADNDVLAGGGGTDWLFGDDGSDVLAVTDDHETVHVVGGDEGGDTDILAFSNYISTAGVTATFSGDETGTFNFDATAGTGSFVEIEQVIGTGYGDIIDASASSADQVLNGAEGDDALTGGSGDDVLSGDDGADTLSGGGGADTLYAGSQDNPEAVPNLVGYWNFASYSAPEDDLAAPDNDADFINGAQVPSASGGLVLDGSDDHALIADDPAYDLDTATISMSFTLDTLTSRSGILSKDATGNETGDLSIWVETDGTLTVRWQDGGHNYLYSAAGTITTGVEYDIQITLDDATGTATLYVDGGFVDSGIAAAATLDGNVQDWVLGATTMTATRGTTDAIANEMDGTITAFAIYDGVHTPAEIAAPAGEQDVIDGGAGDDEIHGDAGDDILSGGDGADTFYLYDFFGSDTITGGEGGDDDDKIDAGGVSMPLTLVYTGAESGTISDGASTISFSEIEVLETGADADTIDATGAGTAGVKIYSGFGDDTVTGSAGGDWISTGKGDDAVQAGAGADTINADYGDDTVWAGEGDDTVWASFGNDAVYGEDGDDYVYGGYGDDTIYGGEGDDEIGVGRDDDTAYGGAGSDQFFFEHDMGSNIIVGGETGTDADIVDFTSLYTDPITVSFTGDEAGTAVDPYGDVTFSEIEVVWGSGFDDVVDAALDGAGIEMHGYAGADTLTGGSGDDIIVGGTGNDVLSGNHGDDRFVLEGGFGNDTVTGGETGEIDGDTLDLTAVNVPLTLVFSGSDAGSVTDGSDTVVFSGIEDFLLGDGADFVSAGSDTDGFSVEAGDGADTVWGGGGDDTLQGGAGDDEIFGDAGADSVEGGDGADDLGGNTGDDTISGGAGDDWIQGNAGANQLSGDAGDDTFEVFTAEGGNDTITGGETGETGGDTLVFTGADGASVTLSGDEAGSYTAGAAAGSFTGIETVELTDHADTFDGAASGADLTLDAGAGADRLAGGSGDDAISGGADNDTISGGAGADTLIGGAGGDFIYSDEGDDVVYGGDDLDVIFSGQGDDTLHGDGGDDIIIVNGAEASTTQVTGGETGETYGDALILSGDGSSSSSVNVKYAGNEAGKFDDGTNSGTFAEIERLTTSSGDDTIDAGAATSGTDISSDSGADSVIGGAGADTIDAGSGDDTITGGAGDDVVTGGSGADTFTFADGDGADTITDFDLADDDVDGFTNDQLDLTALTDLDGNPVNIWDVVVTDTVGDGSGDAILTFPNGESLTLTGVDPAGLDDAMIRSMGIPCLAAGTLIDTPTGERLVEELRPGDRVMTKGGGPQRVIWTGCRRLGAGALAAMPGLRPVRIRAGALGTRRDLLVSPQHRLALGPVGAPTGFAPARWLAADGDGRFRVARGRREVTYVHLLLPDHALIRAEGAWVESFYPGPQGLATLDPAARADLFGRAPALATIRTKADALGAYGPLALGEIRRRALADFIDVAPRSQAGSNVAKSGVLVVGTASQPAGP